MIEVATLAMGLIWFGVFVTAVIAGLCLRNPTTGLAVLHHEIDQLPNVMLGRYLAIFGFSVFAAWYGDFVVLLAWLTAAAFMAFYDAVLYARLNKPYMTHLTAGILTAVAIILVIITLSTNGTL